MQESATVQSSQQSASWEAAYEELVREWHDATSISRERMSAWEDGFDSLVAEVADLKRRGKWVSGPTDVMTVMGRHRDELAHSSVVAWLLTPTGQHGLGTRLLAALLEAGWPAPDYPRLPLDRVVVDQESPSGDRRADIIIYVDDAMLVLENKVDAVENKDQCEDIYRQWIEPARDVRFLLLSPMGRPPLTTRTQEAADAWRSLSYAGLASKLREIQAEMETALPGSEAVRQYISAIASLSLFVSPFVVRPGGGHVD